MQKKKKEKTIDFHGKDKKKKMAELQDGKPTPAIL